MSDGYVKHVTHPGWWLAHIARMHGAHKEADRYAEQVDNCGLCGLSLAECVKANETRPNAYSVAADRRSTSRDER